MAYVDVWNTYHTASTLRCKVAVACAKAAQDILNEDPATANHSERVTWARSALQDADGMAKRILWGVLGNAAVRNAGDAAADADVQAAVDALVELYATLG